MLAHIGKLFVFYQIRWRGPKLLLSTGSLSISIKYRNECIGVFYDVNLRPELHSKVRCLWTDYSISTSHPKTKTNAKHFEGIVNIEKCIRLEGIFTLHFHELCVTVIISLFISKTWVYTTRVRIVHSLKEKKIISSFIRL